MLLTVTICCFGEIFPAQTMRLLVHAFARCPPTSKPNSGSWLPNNRQSATQRNIQLLHGKRCLMTLALLAIKFSEILRWNDGHVEVSSRVSLTPGSDRQGMAPVVLLLDCWCVLQWACSVASILIPHCQRIYPIEFMTLLIIACCMLPSQTMLYVRVITDNCR